jgi:RND family efflux transporter MFP subunit
LYRSKKWIIRGPSILVIGGAAVFAMIHPPQFGAPASQETMETEKAVAVSTAKVQKRSISQKVTLSGVVGSKDSLDIMPDNAGRVISVNADVGQKVSAGDILAQLDASGQKAALEEAKAELAQAQGKLEQASGENSGQVKIAQANVEIARAKLNQLTQGPSEAMLQKAKTALDNAGKEYESLRQYYAFEQSADSPLGVAVAKAEQTLQGISQGTAQTIVSSGNAEAASRGDLKAAEDNLAQVRDEKSTYAIAVQNAQDALNQAQRAFDLYVQTKQPVYSAYDAAYESLLKALVGAKDDLALAQANWSKAIQSAQAALDQKEAAAEAASRLAQAQRQEALRNAQSALDTARASRAETLKKLEQQLAGAQSAVDAAKANLDALTAPPDPNALAEAQAELQKAESQLALVQNPDAGLIASLTAGVDAARAREDAARVSLDRMTIRAPFDGVVSQRNVTAGSNVQPNRAMFTLIGNALEISAKVDEQHLGAIRTGDEAEYTLPSMPGQTYKAKVYQISPTSDTQTLTFNVVLIPEKQDGLVPGETVSLDVVTARIPDALMIPSAAIVNINGHPQVFVVDAGKTARLRDVQTGYTDGSGTQIVKGLAEGDTVVTMGQTFLADGDKVKTDSGLPASGNSPAAEPKSGKEKKKPGKSDSSSQTGDSGNSPASEDGQTGDRGNTS